MLAAPFVKLVTALGPALGRDLEFASKVMKKGLGNLQR